MDDIFYMSTKKVSINDINEIAKRINVKNIFIPKSLDVLQIEYCDGIIADWCCMSVDDFCEFEDKKFLIDNKIKSIFCVSYHPRNFELMLPHIKMLLQEYGGWISNDGDGFQPYYKLQNIDSFTLK